jgi:hypothetical protein
MLSSIWGQGSKTASCQDKKKLLRQNVIIPDSTAGIVTKLKEPMKKWKQYSKAEAEEYRNAFFAEESNTYCRIEEYNDGKYHVAD